MRDLPRLQEALQRPVAWAVLTGRGNYLCRERLAEAQAGHASGESAADVRRLVSWGSATATGDRDELPWEPTGRAWRAAGGRTLTSADVAHDRPGRCLRVPATCCVETLGEPD